MPKGQTTRDGSGKITGSRGLTEKQQRFVENYLSNGGNATAAARSAGYVMEAQDGWRQRQLPNVQRAIFEGQKRKLQSLSTAGLGFLEQLITGQIPDAKPRDRLDASKFVINLAGHVAPKGGEPEADDSKPLEEMSIAELEDFVRRGEAAAKRARQPILEHAGSAPNAPGVEPSGAQAIDITPADTA